MSAAAVVVLGAPVLAQDCPPAPTQIAVRARSSGTDTLRVDYVVTNRTGSRLLWVRIGAGDTTSTVMVNEQIPAITGSPAGWRGQFVVPEETAFFHLWWQTAETKAQPDSVAGFQIRVAGPGAVRPGMVNVYGKPVVPIDFVRLPFTVGVADGRCMEGKVEAAPVR